MSNRILVLDDDPLVVSGLERALQRQGWTVFVANNVPEATLQIRAHDLDAAIVDYDLGRATGIEVLRLLRAEQPACIRLLMTGRQDFPAVMAAVNQGAVARVLNKPFNADELLAHLQDAAAGAADVAQATTRRMITHALADRDALEDCLGQGALDLALQPIVRATVTGIPIGYEALLRPRHPRFPDPGSLIQACEHHRRVHELSNAVFDRAVHVLHRLEPDERLFLNLHPKQFANPDRLAATVDRIADHADQVVLEITERSRLQDIHCWEASVALLQRRGFALAVDDLGAGYSSLAVLADLQPQYIKLDMSLVRNVDREPRKQRLVQLIITFAEATGALAIAEGVETATEAQCLIDSGIHLLQGFYYFRPAMDLPTRSAM